MTILFRPHMVGALMTCPVSMDMNLLNAAEQAIYRKKNRSDEEKLMVEEFWDRGLSKGAKTELTNIAKGVLYGFKKEVSSKEMDKGILCEQDSIDLYNRVNFTRYTKNTERITNDILSGEPDIWVPKVKTIDTKTSWSLDTFPVLSADCHDAMYEWQGRAYMLLADVLEHEVAFCMVSTPDDLIPRWEQVELHKVSHIDPALRITRIIYKRDVAKENKLIRKCRDAQKYIKEVTDMIYADHDLLEGVVPATPAPAIVADWKQEFINA